jgi:hypothetical protein
LKPENEILILEKMIKVGQKLYNNLSLDQPQELFFNYLHCQILPSFNPQQKNQNEAYDSDSLKNQIDANKKDILSGSLMKLGGILKVNVNLINLNSGLIKN